jgi:type IV secretion system protein VirB10
VTEAATPVPPKLNPESLAIRTRPPRAIRFKRGAIIAIAALGSVSLIAVTWLALKPRLFHHSDAQAELSQPNARDTNEAPKGAPISYGDIPKLGPALPGDLGKPILERQQMALNATDPADQQLRQAAAAEQKSARESSLLVKGGQTGTTGNELGAPPATEALPSSEGAKLGLDPASDPNAQSRKAEFVGKLDRSGDANLHALTPLSSPYTLSAGSVIAAGLITGLRSDLPGLVTAQVTENTYDSATGRILLIPQGARLIGSYDSVVAFGQKRALVVWQRIVFPDASSIRIDNVPATDPSGYAGVQDGVDLHTWQLLKGVALSTMLGVSSELALAGQGDLVQALRMSMQNNVSHASDQITQRNLGVQPTITIRPGAPVFLVVHKDLIFEHPARQP